MKLKRYIDMHHRVMDVANDPRAAEALTEFAPPEEWSEYNTLTEQSPDIEVYPPDAEAPASGAYEGAPGEPGDADLMDDAPSE